MPKISCAMDVFKLLEKTNCRECGAPTCLAFAAAVYKGERELGRCPRLGAEVIEAYGGVSVERLDRWEELEEAAAALKGRIAAMDLAERAGQIGGAFADGRLTLKIMGKEFAVDGAGNVYSGIHLHTWIVTPILNYVAGSRGTPVSGRWTLFRELKNGRERAGLFEQTCERRLKKSADEYTDLFEDMIRIFQGKKVETPYTADISLVLHPLPKVPLLVCYWKPEDGLESSLNLFFDETVEDHLSIDAIYAMGTGLAIMFARIGETHGG